MSRPLAELIGVLPDVRIVGMLPTAVERIESDSRRVQPGDLYVALRGQHRDGHAFARAAVACGAVAIVVEHEVAANAPQLVVPDTRAAISRLAASYYGNPSHGLTVAGVTGTNGKTTTVHLLAAVLTAAGRPCATIGTLGFAFGSLRGELANTTPLALELQALLAELRAGGAVAAAMEVSSHALALGRVDDVRFAVAAFTNLTRDHLDFHGTFAAYTQAKRRLLELAPKAAINVDDPVGRTFARDFPAALTYAIDAPADVRPSALELDADGSRFSLDGSAFRVPLRGRFNVYNALAACASARALGIPDAVAARGLADAEPVPGRMERIPGPEVEAIVDYAHTPDALENVLTAARETARGRLIVVFGCGGDRDAGKRPEMGEVAGRLADIAIVTSDNPRSEDPQAIAAAVAGTTAARIVLDRRAAIRAAIALARPGDTVVVAGKGHEAYQQVGAERLPFDDRTEVRAAFAERAKAPAGS